MWHDGLWKVMRDYNIDESLIKIIKALYEDATSAVLQNNHFGEFFRTTVGVRQDVYFPNPLQRFPGKHLAGGIHQLLLVNLHQWQTNLQPQIRR